MIIAWRKKSLIAPLVGGAIERSSIVNGPCAWPRGCAILRGYCRSTQQAQDEQSPSTRSTTRPCTFTKYPPFTAPVQRAVN